MSPAGFDPAIQAGERLQTHALDGSATGIGILYILLTIFEAGAGNGLFRLADGCHKVLSIARGSCNDEIKKAGLF